MTWGAAYDVIFIEADQLKKVEKIGQPGEKLQPTTVILV
jgi:hypothetical protein